MTAFESINRRQLPRFHALVDINYDEKNFLYTIIYHFKQKKFQKVKTTLKPQDFESYMSLINAKSLKFPLHPNDINKFVSRNPQLHLTIALLYCTDGDKGECYPYGFYGTGRNRINLAVHRQVGEDGDLFHYFYIRSNKLDCFLTKKYRDSTGKISTYKGVHCANCFLRFRSSKSLQLHYEMCKHARHQRTSTMQTKHGKKPIIKFKKHKNRFELPIVGFADFESILKPCTNQTCEQCNSFPCICAKSFSVETQQHSVFCYSLIFVDKAGKVFREESYTGQDAIKHFLKTLQECEKDLIAKMRRFRKCSRLKPVQESLFLTSSVCHICRKDFTCSDTKVRDHCHMTGEFLGAAHQTCNLLRIDTEEIPIFFHNGTRYDFHFIIAQLDARFEKISVLAKNSEQFRSISLNSFRLLDSIDHLPASLDELVEDLKRDNRVKFQYLLQWSELIGLDADEKKIKTECASRKGIFPYEFITDYQKLIDAKCIPPIEDFYSSLNNSEISREDHRFASRMFKLFECSNMLDYAKLYCSIDVFLLCEVLMHYRRNTMKSFNLDPCRYYGTPSLAFDIMLDISNVELELFTSMDEVDFIRSAIRGGQSFIATKKAKGGAY